MPAWEQVLSTLRDAGVPGPVQVDDFRRTRAYGGPTGERSCHRPPASLLRAIGTVLNPRMFCMPELADPGVVHPDIVLRSSERTIIVDTKFYRKPLDTRFDGRRVHSDNLYQIFAYVANWAAASADDPEPEGWLLYAAVDGDFDYRFELMGRLIRVCSIDLRKGWREIEEDLKGLVHGARERGRILSL